MRAEVATAQQLPLICEYMREKTDVVFNPSMCAGFAVLADDNTFIAGVLISNVRYNGDKAVDCEISCATETSVAWRPEVCRAVFGYIFKQLGCVRCTS
jgi:hypothetical protein